MTCTNFEKKIYLIHFVKLKRSEIISTAQYPQGQKRWKTKIYDNWQISTLLSILLGNIIFIHDD